MSALAKLTLKQLLKNSAATYGSRLALAQVDGISLTFTELSDKVQQVSEQLHEHGIVAGDRVAILSENRPQWGIAYFAITTMGAVVVPILTDFHANEISHILRHSECKAAFISDRIDVKIEEDLIPPQCIIFRIEDFTLRDHRQNQDRLHKIVSDGRKELSKIKETALRLAGLMPAEVQEDDLAAIIYTSGTTGHSKGVMLSHKNIVSNAIATTQIIDINCTDRLLSVLPLSHAYECTLGFITVVMVGAAVYYIDKPPTARVLTPVLMEVRPTMMLTVPLVIEKIYKTRILPKFNKSWFSRMLYHLPVLRKKFNRIAGKKLVNFFGGELKSFCIGGAGLAQEVEQFLREAGFPYAIGYGLTETSPLVTGTDPAGTVYRSAGCALPGVEIKINAPNTETGEGEVLVRGPSVMKGYYNDPVRTQEVLTPDGWFRTGDLGYIDRNGFLFIKGRLKNMILGPSGENIYPEEIESIINEFQEVSESLVFDQSGQLVAKVHLNYEVLDERFSSQHLKESEIKERIRNLLEHLRLKINERVASYCRIKKIIEQAEPFELTPTKKIKRYLYI